MVNNQKKRGKTIPPLIPFIFLIAFCTDCYTQKISKYYTASMQENGMLYFIEPKQEFKNKKEGSELSYDLTCLTSKDSLSLNFTYSDHTIRAIDSLSFVHDGDRISSTTEKLFIEADKDFWKHRYSAKFAFDEIRSIFQQEKKPTVLIYYDSKITQLKIKNSDWERKSKIMSKILTLIRANK